MKKNTFKRVLAGSLALLTVAAYMPANVGGLIQVKDSLVANADSTTTENFIFTNAKPYLTSINDGGSTPLDEDMLARLGDKFSEPAGTAVTVTSKVPLTFAAAPDSDVSAPTGSKDLEIEGLKTYTNGYLVKDGSTLKRIESDNAPSSDYVGINPSNVAYEYDGKWYTDATVTPGISAGTTITQSTGENEGDYSKVDALTAKLGKEFGLNTNNFNLPTTADSNKILVALVNLPDASGDVLKYILVPASYGKYSETATNGETVVKFGNNASDDVMEALLKANNIETEDATYTAASEFLHDDSGVTYLAVEFKAIEPVRNQGANGVYTYDFTVPEKALGAAKITANVISKNATVKFFADDTKRTNGDVDSDLSALNGHWSGLTITDAMNTSKAAALNSSTTVTSGSATLDGITLGSTIKVSNDELFALYVDDKVSGTKLLQPSVTYDSTTKKFVSEFTMPEAYVLTEADVAEGGNYYHTQNPHKTGSAYYEAGDELDVELQLVKVQEKYTYSVSSSDTTKLIANSDSVKDVEAASITVKSYESTDTNYFPATGTDNGVAVGSDALEYGRTVAIKTVAGDKFIQNGEITLKKGSQTVYSSKSGASNTITPTGTPAGATATGVLAFKNMTSGTYTVTYDVTAKSAAGTTTNPAFSLTQTFTVDARGKITADNVKLRVSVKKDNVVQNLNGIIADATDPKNSTSVVNSFDFECKAGKKVEILLTEAAKEAVNNNEYTFFVTPIVTSKDGVTLNETTSSTTGSYIVSGKTFGSKNKVYTVDITVTDPEYGGSANADPISIDWTVIDYDSTPQFEKSASLSVAEEDVSTLGEQIIEKIAKNDAAKALTTKNVTFEYVTGADAADRTADEDELDSYDAGLPTEKGTYTVYVTYDGEVKSQVTVKVNAYKVVLVPDASSLDLTYGDALAFDNYTLKDSKGKTVKDVTLKDLQVQFMMPTYEKKNGVWVQTGKYVELDDGDLSKKETAKVTDGTKEVSYRSLYDAEVKTDLGYKTNSTAEFALNAPIAATALDNLETEIKGVKKADGTDAGQGGRLNAGTYYVKFTATSTNEDYSFDDSEVYEITVSRKKLSDESVSILIDPGEYTGSTLTPNENSITAVDADTKYTFGNTGSKVLRLTEGVSAIKVGAYDVEVGLTSNASQNYEGTATAKWHVVNKEAASSFNPNLKWDDTMTTLYDNGRIHLEINKTDISKLALPKGTDGKELTIEAYGVIVDNSGLISKPEAAYGTDYSKYTAGDSTAQARDVAKAEKQLTLNNGFVEGKYTAKGTTLTDGTKVNANSVTYKTNVKVKSVETGIWARPYVLLSDGTVKYGPVKYVNLEQEAIDKLNLQMPYTDTKNVVRQANLTDTQKKKAYNYVNAGYDPLQNKFYAYATFTDLNSEGFKGTVLEVSDFGVVVDNKGVIAKGTASATVKEKLVIGGDSKLVVGHYQKGNKNLAGDNEYTANIKTYNSVTGAWIRTYLDLGGGLIVYGEPIYVQSASDYFNTFNSNSAVIGTLEATAEGGDSKKAVLNFAPNGNLSKVNTLITKAYTDAATSNKAKDAPEVTIVKTGVVLDKKGTLKQADGTKWGINTDTSTAAATTLYPTADAELLLGNGFVEGKKTSGFTTYTGKVSPAAKDLIVRNYVVYDIGGTEVTVYGAPQAYKYDSSTTKWVLNIPA